MTIDAWQDDDRGDLDDLPDGVEIDAALVLSTIRQYTTLRDKKTTTNGGEYCGPCPRCGGEDRFIVWPHRPLVGGSERRNPVFMCRHCMRPDNPSKPWTGDLLQFLQDMGTNYFDACAQLGVTTSKGKGAKRLRLNAGFPYEPPSEAFQVRCFGLVDEAEQRLWSPEGAPFRRYLMDERKLTEATIREARLGCIRETRYEEPALWDEVGGKIALPRGIVIPELHEGGMKCYSLSIRRANRDIEDEFLETGKKGRKYHVVRGSKPGLYLADDLEQDMPAVLVEAPIDALSIKQEAGQRYAAVATLSATGARKDKWISLLALCSVILLGQDPDGAGRAAVDYWLDILSNSHPATHPLGDYNFLLTEGYDIFDFLVKCERSYWALSNATVELTPKALEIAPGSTRSGLDEDVPPMTQVSIEKPQILVSDVSGNTINPETGEVIERASEENVSVSPQEAPETVVTEVVALPEPAPVNDLCYVCGTHVEPLQAWGSYPFCAAHYQGLLLMQYGARMPEQGRAAFSRMTFKVHGQTKQIQGGKDDYLSFLSKASKEELFWAWLHARAVVEYGVEPYRNDTQLTRPAQVQGPQRPCARCGRETIQFSSRRLQFETLQFCDKCLTYPRLLKFGDLMGYPSCALMIHGREDGSVQYCQEGHDAWLTWIMQATNFEVQYAYDHMTKQSVRMELMEGRWQAPTVTWAGEQVSVSVS